MDLSTVQNLMIALALLVSLTNSLLNYENNHTNCPLKWRKLKCLVEKQNNSCKDDSLKFGAIKKTILSLVLRLMHENLLYQNSL